MAETIDTLILAIKDSSNKIIKLLTNTKKCAKAKITRGYLETRIETLSNYWASYSKQYDYMIAKFKAAEFKAYGFDPELNYDITEEAYMDLNTLVKDNLYEIKKTEQTTPPPNVIANESVKLRPKLPPISIPTFSGDYVNWMSFRDMFTTLIHNEDNLTKIEKHHYLRSCLSGEAEQLLKHFALTEANYEEAWQTLGNRYNNKRIIVNNILNRFLNQKKLASESAEGVKELLDTSKECLNSLNNLEIDTSKWDAIVVHLIVSKLDIESHRLWEHSLGSSTNIPTFKELASHLEGRFRSMEMIKASYTKDKSIPTKQKPHTFRTFMSEVDSTCTYCTQNHYVCHCKDFAALKIEERQDFVKKNNICFNCLIKGHAVNYCRQSTSCRKCGRRHHTLLHYTNPNKPDEPSSDHNSEGSVSMKTETQNEQVILATAQIAAKSKNGRLMVLRALIDPGSQASFVTEAAAQLLNLDRISVNGKITGISNTSVVTTKSMVTLNFHSIKDRSSQIEVNAYVLRKLTSLLPSQEFPADVWPLSKGLDLADPEFHKPGSIDVLLGADVHAHIILEGLQKQGSLIALNSSLGWLISGRVTQTASHKHNVVVSHVKLEVDQLLRQFWEVEEYLPFKRPMTPLEIKCEEHYKNTHARTSAGQYVVSLPFKDDPTMTLGDSRPLAVKRLIQMEKRFAHKSEFKEEYCEFMRQYKAQGHMEKLTEKEERDTTKGYYLPHHAVLRPSSLSTKLRVVFDGSAAPTTGKSLNEELMIGPSLQQDMRELITRWRQHKFCLVADVQKMYRQILVKSNDCDYQRIVWRETPYVPIEEYRLLTVTYGTSCAPFLAIRTLRQLAEDEREEFPREAEILQTDLYMDDLMTGAATEEDAVLLQKRLTELLARGSFPLHKWASNSESVLCQIPDNDKDSQGAVNIKVKDTMKALGVTWNSQTDNFELNTNLNCLPGVVTKRNVLSTIAKTFDPLGWLAPAIIILKLFMQKLWLAGLEWDDELPEPLKCEWHTYLRNFDEMKHVTLPRWLGVSDNVTKIELHGFCDASCLAYAGVVYLRVSDGNDVKVSLIMAKTKVAPVKQVSLPRLELCGAVLLARMLTDLKTVLKIQDNHVKAWTDSTIVLAWLRKTPGTWTTFVANRTSEILTSMNSSQWHHVESSNNSADPATRGLFPKELQESQLWWEGPGFLRDPEISFKITTIPETGLESKKKMVVTHICSDNDFKSDILKRFSGLLKLIRVTAYCLRFLRNCKDKIVNSPITKNTAASHLTANELKIAFNTCIRTSQSLSFGQELNLLSQGKNVSKGSKIYALNPYIDNDKIIRVGGRLVNAQISDYLKYPILLMHDCPLSELILVDAHLKTLHGGHQLTLNYVRQKFWIVRVKNLVKKVIRRCIPCFKQRANPIAPFMGNLPEFRVKPSRPFRTSGVDFAGPFTLKLYSGRCNRTYKAYVCLFVCTVTKAIHLEVVSDLTSSAFIAAFKRFTSRRGHCADIWSDCGTNFVGASRELDMAFKHLNSQLVVEISDLLSNDQTTWHFIPPGAPHFGGLWESGVKSVKGHLKRVIGQIVLTFEEFVTLLTQVEACVNSRPLTLINSFPDEPPLTPGHFLIGEPPISVPEESYLETKLSPLDRWHIVQRIVQTLWKRWQIEYLSSLQQRYKWSKNLPDIPLGTVVLVKDDRLPPGKWLLGRVIDKHPGSDGITRVVTLQYKNNVFKRPVTKLCPLPIDADRT